MNLGKIIESGNKELKETFGVTRANTVVPNPKNDGITHVNIFITSKSKLGKFIAEDNHPFKIEPLGRFNTLDGFILYVMHKPLEKYKRIGRKEAFITLRKLHIPENKVYKTYIKDAYRSLFSNNREMRKLLIENTLPYYSYYLRKVELKHHKNEDGEITIPTFTRRDAWLPKMIESIAEEFRNKAPNDKTVILEGDYDSALLAIHEMMESVEEVNLEPTKRVDTEEVQNEALSDIEEKQVTQKGPRSKKVLIRHRVVIQDDEEDIVY